MNTTSTSTRSIDSLRHQFEVEKELAARLRSSSREERTELFKTLYTELFTRVADHPRLTRVGEASYQERVARTQVNLLRSVLGPDKVLVEFAPGDCHLARAVAPLVQRVIGVDISDQRAADAIFPGNLELVVYDGFHLPLPDGCADIVFSYQFLEHLHPDDVQPHFDLAARLLRPGGVYVLDTPHRHSGPHDIARYFGDELDCLHLQEWTYADLRRIAHRSGFGKAYAYRFGKPLTSAIANLANDGGEWILGLLPKPIRRRLARRPLPSVTLMAVKD